MRLINDNGKTCDLHVHSTFSDGTLTPRELLSLAKTAGLSAVALTDHNTIEGLSSFYKESKNFEIEAIGGVEISSEYKGKELHILALFITEEKFNKVEEFLHIPKQRKEENNEQLANRLVENGYEIDYREIKREAGGFINRVHFANALIKKGYIKSVQEGFETILSEKNGLYKPPKRLTAFEVLRFIKSINAVSVLAHPLLDLSKEELPAFLKEAKDYGLTAMEVRYSKYSLEDQEYCESVARDFKILSSGGSDFHGSNKPDIKIGEGKGNLKIPYEFVTKLKGVL